MALHRSDSVMVGRMNAFQLGQDLRFHAYDPDTHVAAALANLRLRWRQPVLVALAGVEHIIAGNAGFQTSSLADSLGEKPFKIGGVDLSYGEIIALAGDYYATFDSKDAKSGGYTGTRKGNKFVSQPLKDATDIKKALEFASMERSEDDTHSKEINDHLKLLVKSHTTYKGYHPPDSKTAAAQNWILSRSDTDLRCGILSLENWDHFHPHCIVRYRKLHERAKLLANKQGLAFSKSDDRLKLVNHGQPEILKKWLAPCLEMNAFADHFLTDAFSSGHFYGRRKEDYDNYPNLKEAPQDWWFDPDIDPKETLLEIKPHDVTITVGEVIAGKLAKDIHDQLGNGTEAACNAFRNPKRMPRGREHIPFKCYGDWHLHEKMPSAHDLTLAKVQGMPEQMRFLFLAVTSSIREVTDEFLRAGATGLGDWHEGAAQLLTATDFDAVLLTPLDYVPHPISGKCGCVRPLRSAW